MAVTTIGQAVTLSWAAPSVDPAVVLTVTLPDGTSATPTVAQASPYTAPFTPTQAGRHVIRWSQTGATMSDVLDVWPADPRYLISIDDALEAVKVGGSAPASTRADIPLYIAAATYVIEDICGPLVRTLRTARFDGGKSAVVLPAMPVSVLSVTVDGTLLSAADYVVDEDAGIIYYDFPATALRNVSVSYMVGSATIAPNLRLACMEQVRFLWQTTRVGTGRAAQELGYTPSGYAVPYMVQGLCAPQNPAPGFA